MTPRTRHRRWRTASLALVPLATLVLAACAPTPAPAPTPSASAASATRRSSWPAGDKDRYVAPPPCSGTYSEAVETCHLTYKPYVLDTTSSAAQSKANSLAGMSPAQCVYQLALFHTSAAQLWSSYPGSSSVAENLYCLYFSTGQCAGAQYGAQRAINGWLNSPGHKANMDAFAGRYVNAAAVCKPPSSGGYGVYVAVAQFHT